MPGHTTRTCRRKAKCGKCGNLKHDEKCRTNEIKCAACGGSHKALNKSCPVIIREKAIERVMALENKARDDARKVIDGVNPTSGAIASKESFPELTAWNAHASFNRFQSLTQEIVDDSNDSPSTQFNATYRKPARAAS